MTPEQEIERRGELTSAHSSFQKGLIAHAYFKLNDHAVGEDLVQDTFLKTWAYLVKGGEIDIMKAFLYHILNHLIIDQYRKHKTTSLEVLLESGFEPGTDESARLFSQLDGKALQLLIKRLPMKYRKVMRMRYVREMSLREMSVITGETKNALAVQSHRGLKMLKVLFERKEQDA